MGKHIHANELDIWTEQVGEGPDVLLIGGLGDTVESWQFQLDGLADRYRLTAFDNRGAGRTVMPEGPVSVEAMADDAAAVLGALGKSSAQVAGFSGGSIIAQELALRHPDVVRSLVLQSTWPVMDPYLRQWLSSYRSWARSTRIPPPRTSRSPAVASPDTLVLIDGQHGGSRFLGVEGRSARLVGLDARFHAKGGARPNLRHHYCSSSDATVDWRAPSAVPTQLRTDHGLERPRRPPALATQRASDGRGVRR